MKLRFAEETEKRLEPLEWVRSLMPELGLVSKQPRSHAISLVVELSELMNINPLQRKTFQKKLISAPIPIVNRLHVNLKKSSRDFTPRKFPKNRIIPN